MKKQIISTLSLIILCSTVLYAQEQEHINLSAPVGSSLSDINKSNATLLQENSGDANQVSDRLHTDKLNEKYKADLEGANGSIPSQIPNTSTGLDFNTNTMQPQTKYNSTQYNQNLGNGIKASSTIYTDESGKVRTSNSGIQFGGKK